ncbi:hypothetical protein LguiA_021698 [Lonicera macranthoides]
MVRSSRGLSEPGTLFKNLMAILRNVVCYDATVRNVCSHSVIQFEYGVKTRIMTQSLFAAGELVGVLAAIAMSTPAYKAVLDSSPSNNSSWETMKYSTYTRLAATSTTLIREFKLHTTRIDSASHAYCSPSIALYELDIVLYPGLRSPFCLIDAPSQ